MPEIYIGILLWLALQTVFLIAAWARMETRIGHMADSLQRLWSSHDELHPRSSNPGERDHNGHNHEEE
ncbi:hypothetical protein LCGC14_2991960 [marine sediment metagenome]|uniref:Uncharacterized protein n=1 Tax=marine sediment metagenome TaxID=412755 RepID=A0A0F8X455_9ZZZZ